MTQARRQGNILENIKFAKRALTKKEKRNEIEW